MRIALFLSALVSLFSCGTASAVTLTFQEGVDGYSGTVDTWNASNSAGTNYGNDIYINMDGNNPDGSTAGERQGFLRFNDIFGTSSNKIYPGSTILSATLRVFVSNNGATVGVHRMLQPWNESITYGSSFGGDGVDANGIEAAITPSGTLTLNTSSDYREVDLTADLQFFTDNPGQNFGWSFLQDVDNPGRFDSSDIGTIANRPELMVELIQFVPVPEPGSGVLCLLGLLALSRVNRQRNRR